MLWLPVLFHSGVVVVRDPSDPPEPRYQFVSGSPRHSPTVTARQGLTSIFILGPNGLTSLSTFSRRLDNTRKNILDRVLMDIVHENDGASVTQAVVVQIYRGFGTTEGRILPIVGVDISNNDFIPQLTEYSKSSVAEAKVWRTHVDGVLTYHVNELVAQQCHLLLNIIVSQGSKIRMAVSTDDRLVSCPCALVLSYHLRVRCNLMSFIDHPVNSGLIVLNIPQVVPIEEECGLEPS